ncbi:hypothetical protein DI487_15275 [Flavobacterium sediminis]|uniref:Phosphoribosylpyrophosphate synthetase n=1 Tax=Flavobacterium sediminis TaxID=2201181 RepID=A0A2U8QXX9_9FLAO|nr:hypothetical protein [Flavobacterium sediminis]AWM15077.1 hypothetical protein DI487_15275 [Flavobacterium sediminis]
MATQYHYASVSEALEELRKIGFVYDFNIHEEEIITDPDGFIIKHVYRYEGNSNPDDEAIVYGIASFDGKKGVFVSGFSAKTNSEAIKIIQNIVMNSES